MILFERQYVDQLLWSAYQALGAWSHFIVMDIREFFPSDCNPFYAGFGNRDTDDFSYLKGEVAVNRRVDTRLYSTLHALVNGMFPSMSSSVQEDISSWNYWKLLSTLSIYEGVSHNFCLTSNGFGVANASSGIKLTWTFILHIFFPDRFCKLLEENLLRERAANFFYVFLFGAKVLTGIVLVGGMICCQSHNVMLCCRLNSDYFLYLIFSFIILTFTLSFG